MTIVSVDIERGEGLEEIRRRLGDSGLFNKELRSAVREAARLGEHSAKMYAPDRSGRLRRAIFSSTEQGRDPNGRFNADLNAVVGVREVNELAGGGLGPMRENQGLYPLFVHEGTGLYGKYHRLITPRRASHMRFVGHTGLVFAKTTKGQRPQPFIREALDDVEAYLPQRLDEMVSRILDSR